MGEGRIRFSAISAIIGHAYRLTLDMYVGYLCIEDE